MKILNILTILCPLAGAQNGTGECPNSDPDDIVGSQPHPTGQHPPFNFTGTNITFPPPFSLNGTNTTSPHPPEPPQVYRGFSIGAWQGGQTQPIKQPQNWTDAFNRIKNTPGGFNSARTYAVDGALPNILAAANDTGVHVLVGLYLGRYDGGARFNTEFGVLRETVGQYGFEHIIGIMVGNEDLYRGDSPSDLIASEIKQVQDWLDKEHPDACVGVGHVDTWTNIVNATNKPVTDASDFLVANIFPYWENSTLSNAPTYFDAAIQNITAFEKEQDIEVWIGETGWPFAHPGQGKQGLVDGKESLQRYWKAVVCSEGFQQRNAFYYIDCDGGDQPEWGVYELDGAARLDSLECGPV